MQLSDFNYHLPKELIAQTPLHERTASRLLCMDKEMGDIIHSQFQNIKDILKKGDVLVLNTSRVIPARIPLQKDISGFSGEIFLIKPLSDTSWECLISPGKKFQVGTEIFLSETMRVKTLSINEKEELRILQFSEDVLPFIQEHGEIPLPPYISQKLEDKERYQTVFSHTGVSVAAPTAGLHFSKSFLAELKEKGIEIHSVHLDVGLGTFRPVKQSKIEDHIMHSEYFSLDKKTADAINIAKKEKRRVIAIGTTSVRVLESASNEEGILIPQSGETDIFIYPGYSWKIIDGLLTNFHLPKSTLLMLVSAFSSREHVLNAYHEAIQEKYRFYSFGDAMMLL